MRDNKLLFGIMPDPGLQRNEYLASLTSAAIRRLTSRAKRHQATPKNKQIKVNSTTTPPHLGAWQLLPNVPAPSYPTNHSRMVVHYGNEQISVHLNLFYSSRYRHA